VQGAEAKDERPIAISVEGGQLLGDLAVPAEPAGLVVFAHGSGSSRMSPRNRAVAQVLVDAGLATLLMDLLTAEEEVVDLRTRELRFDVALLGRRVVATIDELASDPAIGALPVGCFGASTGAAAALIAAADRPERVRAVVSRGGRPDLAGAALSRVTAPTLLIVGERDPQVVGLNREAQALLAGESRLEIVPGATHLFEEPGALERVAALAREWFVRRLGAARSSMDEQQTRDHTG
jgi:putative phosphoribosyl transferase